MNDPFLVVARVVALVFPPLFLLMPWVFTLFFKTRDQSPASRAQVAWLNLALVVATGVMLALWLGLLLAGNQTKNPILQFAAQFSWVGFFPLWFGLAMPLVVRKQPALGPEYVAATGTIRSARLVNRTRALPIGAWHWVLLAVVLIAGVGAILARGWMQPFVDDTDRSRWLLYLGLAIGQALLVSVSLPWGLRRTLSESEPMDANGNPDLAAMYDRYRNAKVLCLFWLLGIGQPAFFGAFFCLMTWRFSTFWAILLGSVGGTLIGVVGAVVGTRMGLWRAQIAEFKAGLEGKTVSGDQAAF